MKNLRIFTLGVSVLVLSSCATIFEGTKADVKITSNPPNLKVYSINKQEQLTEIGTTPCVVTIHKKHLI